MSLIAIFDKLSLPSNAKAFSAQPVEKFSSYRVGKSKQGFPLLLIKADGSEDRAYGNIQLRNISVIHDLECNIETSGKKATKSRFTIIHCHIAERSIHESFLEVAELLISSLGNKPSAESIDELILKILEMFRRLAEPPIKAIQGLWAELLLIALSSQSKALLRCWHFDDKDKYDFSSGKERVEVKSYSTPYRSHSFSIEQLNPPYGCELLVASINTVRSHSGRSIDDLRSHIQAKVKGDASLVEALRLKIMSALGKDYRDSIHVRFDYELAVTSLKHFKHLDIPKIDTETIPKLVFDVKFRVDLSSLNETLPSKLRKPGTLFSSLPK